MVSSLLALLGVDEGDRRVQTGRKIARQIADVVETLTRARHCRKLTQKQVAAEMETTQSAISHFERIGGDPRLSTLLRYADAIGANVRLTVTFNGAAPYVTEEPKPMTVSGAGMPTTASGYQFSVVSDRPIEVPAR